MKKEKKKSVKIKSVAVVAVLKTTYVADAFCLSFYFLAFYFILPSSFLYFCLTLSTLRFAIKERDHLLINCIITVFFLFEIFKRLKRADK